MAAVLGLSETSGEVADWLSALLEAELIQPSPTSRLPAEKELGFRHALVRDAVYGLLTASDLATGHRLAGEFLMDLGEVVRLAQEASDKKIELSARVNGTEICWLELGDRDGARGRMLALEERLSQGQEGLLSAVWSIYFAEILCECPEERAWDQAEALIAGLLSRTRGMGLVQAAAQRALARLALARGQLEKAEELARASMQMFRVAPMTAVPASLVLIRALTGLGRASEACLVAEQVTGALLPFGGCGCIEVELRLAVAEAFEANGDSGRARAELGEALRQIKLREDDITDPFWRESYLSKNPYCARALELGRAWGWPL